MRIQRLPCPFAACFFASEEQIIFRWLAGLHHPDTLADLYDPLTMPPELLKVHQQVDAAMDKAYETSCGKKSYKSVAERVAFLFELYQKLTRLMPADQLKRPRSPK